MPKACLRHDALALALAAAEIDLLLAQRSPDILHVDVAKCLGNQECYHFAREHRKQYLFGANEVPDLDDAVKEIEKYLKLGGVVIAATHVPGGYADFVEYVVPELQRRELYHVEYSGETLRENLGLPRPRVGAWKAQRLNEVVSP